MRINIKHDGGNMDTRRAKRLLRVSLFGLVMVAMAQWTAFGADQNEDISQGDVVCDQQGTVYRITGKTDQHTITVKGGTETNPIQVDLNGVDMDLSKQKKSPLTVESGYVEIFIGKDNADAKNTLTAGQEGYAGLRIRPGTHVTISGKGKLTATGGNSGAGIGSNSGENISDLTLNGAMTIDATGGSSAAGIGSGHKGKVENLVIKKGTITAKGGKWGAGIGAGDDGTGQNLVIEGGNITATGGADGAGIGGGDGDKSSGNRNDGLMRQITINGGTIKATGGVSAAGIGGGDKMEVNGLVISGGDIEAVGGEYGPGVGGGKNSAMKNLEIKGGTVKATGGAHAAGVGGANHDCSDITISGGIITAKGGGHAAGVGSGDDARMDRLTISGGKITAVGGEKAAGIGAGDHEGGGDGGDLSALKITGGDIEATGGNQGAGIGGSDCGTVDSLSIDQQTGVSLSIKATGGGLAAGIGSANHDVRDMSIKLDGGTIIAKGGTQGAGIGAGTGDTGKIDISGKGSIQATGGKRGAGIGAGQNHGSGAITISGSTDASKTRHLRVEAAVDMGSSGDFNTTAAIGSGKASGGNITIKNAVVTVSADHDAASIGGGKFHITEGGAVNKISIENCQITEEGKNKSAAGIGSGVGGTIKAIEIKNSEYDGASIGSSSWAQHTSTPNNIDSITIEGSDIKAHASDPGANVPWAGIGSGPWGGVGNITIKKSKVDAKGFDGGAGIGSGGWADSKTIVMYYGGNMGNMLIEDSEIKAAGGKGGAGLGGGFDTSTGDITISNSKVDASTNTDTGDGATAIGGGRAASAGNITIKNGSTVTATGGKHSAGIGCSGDSSTLTMMWQTEVKSISIDGSTVTATGGDGGAGIGSGRGGRLSKSITIKDSVVTASGGPYGAGIGSGSKGEGTRGGDTHDITIKGNSKITATGGNGAAGIGAGLQGGADDITLALTTDADRTWFVKATGGAGAAGIGSGSPNTTDHDVFTQEGYRTNNITINGGYICARGGGDRKNLGSGAGIGGGARKGTLHGFVMTGGYVEAFSGAGDAFDIGHGGEGGVSQAFHDDDFHISGGTVTAQRISTDPGIRISGGSVRCRLSGAKDENGTKVYQTTFQLEQEANTKVYSLKTSKQGYGTKDIFSDGNKKIYLYLPESSANKATADTQVKSNEQARHYYGTTSTNGAGVLKMDGTISAWRFSPGPVAGEEFTAYLDDENLKDWNFQFEMEEGSCAEIREVVQATSPGAAVKAYGKSFGSFTIRAKGTNEDDPVYWSMSANCTMNITREKGRISITENLSKVYDGKPVTDPAVSKNGDGAVTYKYYKGSKGEGTALSGKPTDAGTYTVVAEMAESRNYTAAASEPETFTIEKRPVIIGLSATGTNDTVTIQAVIMGAVDANGNVKFTVDGTTIARTVSIQGKNGLFVAESGPITKDSIPEGNYTVTAEYQQDAPENYSCQENPVSETYHKNLEFRTITGQDSFDKTYGDSAFGLGAGVESGKAVSGSDKFQYEVMYDAYHAAYPELPSAAAVDKDSGQVTVENAGQVIIQITLSDTREHPVYADAVKYVRVKVGQANLEVTSYAENKEGETKTAQYGTLGSLKCKLKYQGFKNGDNEKTFTKNHGTLGAVVLTPTLGVSNGEQYEIGITRVGVPLKIGDKQYENVFLSRNYELKLVNGKIGVTPASLTVKAQDAKGTWNVEPKYAYQITGFTAWDSEETVFGKKPAADLDTNKTSGKSYDQLDPGTYPEAVGATGGTQNKNGNGKENYTISIVAGNLTIEKATPDLTVNAVSKAYDGTPVQVTTTVTAEDPLQYDGPDPQLTYYRFGADGIPSAMMQALTALHRPITPKSIEPVSMEPVNAGNYYTRATVAESTHFNEAADQTFFVILKANPKPDIPELPDMQMRQGLKLSDQSLPDGWEWMQPETALNVGHVRRLARYTPQDTENYRAAYHYLEFSVLGDPAEDDSDNNDNNGGDPTDPSAPSGSTDPSGKDDGTQGTGEGDNEGKSSDPAAGGTVNGNGRDGGSGNGPSSSKTPTGDESGSWIWLAIIAATASLGTLVALRIRRREQ